MLSAEYSKTVKSLNKFFKVFNKELFDNGLSSVIVTVQSNGRSKNAMGWFTVGKLWKDKETDDDSLHEINISAEYLHRTGNEILVTLLHEMVHLYCKLNDIQDTSRNGRWHNKKFKSECEARLLTVEKYDGIGWSHTIPTTELIELIEKNLDDSDQFTIYRAKSGAGAAKKKQRIFKYECPMCGGKVRGSKELELYCCGEEMEVTTNV